MGKVGIWMGEWVNGNRGIGLYLWSNGSKWEEIVYNSQSKKQYKDETKEMESECYWKFNSKVKGGQGWMLERLF